MIRRHCSMQSPENLADDCPADQRARDRLHGSSYPELRRLDCSLAGGVLTVRGRVASFYLKQVAWSLVAEIADVHEYADGIEVGPGRHGIGPCAG